MFEGEKIIGQTSLIGTWVVVSYDWIHRLDPFITDLEFDQYTVSYCSMYLLHICTILSL